MSANYKQIIKLQPLFPDRIIADVIPPKKAPKTWTIIFQNGDSVKWMEANGRSYFTHVSAAGKVKASALAKTAEDDRTEGLLQAYTARRKKRKAAIITGSALFTVLVGSLVPALIETFGEILLYWHLG